MRSCALQQYPVLFCTTQLHFYTTALHNRTHPESHISGALKHLVMHEWVELMTLMRSV